MRSAIVTLAASLLVLAGCSGGTDQPTSSAVPMTEAPASEPSVPQPSPGVETAARVAVAYAAAVRDHDAGAIYDLAWSGLRRRESRAGFAARTRLDDVTEARLSGTVEVGWTDAGERLAVAPIIVTAKGVRQIGRVLLVREAGQWRYYDVTTPEQVPDLLPARP